MKTWSSRSLLFHTIGAWGVFVMQSNLTLRSTWFVQIQLTHMVHLVQVMFERTYNAKKSFEIGTRWFMANSQMVAEMVRHWNSKAANLSFHMFPVPNDPFAHAMNPRSPPLRCPVVVTFDPVGVSQENVSISSDYLKRLHSEHFPLLRLCIHFPSFSSFSRNLSSCFFLAVLHL